MDFPPRWIHGSPDCRYDPDPPFQVHRLASGTYALRESKCHSFEAPFLYLLLGDTTALLLDSGATPDDGRPLPIREGVDSLLAEIGAEKLPLLVAHTHAHGDHVQGDPLLAARANTRVVGVDLASVRAEFGITAWPEGEGAIDLGNRSLTVLPTPGHEPTHVMIYDEATQTLFSGDNLYPGLLTVRDWPAYRASAARVAAFARNHAISQVLGCHIEMSREPGRLYPLGTTYQPEEHVLQLGAAQVFELHEVCEEMRDAPRTVARDDFVVQPMDGHSW